MLITLKLNIPLRIELGQYVFYYPLYHLQYSNLATPSSQYFLNQLDSRLLDIAV